MILTILENLLKILLRRIAVLVVLEDRGRLVLEAVGRGGVVVHEDQAQELPDRAAGCCSASQSREGAVVCRRKWMLQNQARRRIPGSRDGRLK